jgi:hypothetical protein
MRFMYVAVLWLHKEMQGKHKQQPGSFLLTACLESFEIVTFLQLLLATLPRLSLF